MCGRVTQTVLSHPLPSPFRPWTITSQSSAIAGSGDGTSLHPVLPDKAVQLSNGRLALLPSCTDQHHGNGGLCRGQLGHVGGLQEAGLQLQQAHTLAVTHNLQLRLPLPAKQTTANGRGKSKVLS